MVNIEKIPVSHIEEFWQIHYRYLIDEGLLTNEEEKEYFKSPEYRNAIESLMNTEIDRLHMVYFVENGVRIGAAQYLTYRSEDGKCFILDYWVFPQYRGNGTGHRCFECLAAYTGADGALYYMINCDERENAIRFWKSLGFVENGVDEHGSALYIRKT